MSQGDATEPGDLDSNTARAVAGDHVGVLLAEAISHVDHLRLALPCASPTAA